MSRETTSESRSGSSNSSSSHSSSSNQMNTTSFSDDLTLFGSPAPTFTRTGTVVRRTINSNNNFPSGNNRIASITSSTEDDDGELIEKEGKDYQFNRHSLAAVTERKNSFSMNDSRNILNRISSSVDNISLDSTDYHLTNTISTGYKTDAEKRTESPGSSSYLSWIESVNSEYYGSASSNAPVQDADQKVGEWNNFWLNYSTARMRHFSTEQTFSSDGGIDGTMDEMSDDGKKHLQQKNSVDKDNSTEYVMLTVDEVNEAIKCSQKFTEILQNALKRTDQKDNNSSDDDSLSYSQPLSQAQMNMQRDSLTTFSLNRERSISCAIDPQSLQKQKHLLKNSQHQSSSTGCINAILNSGVADILKKVISKRRDVIGSEMDSKSVTRSSFSEWSSK